MPIATRHELEELEAELQGRNVLEINHPVGPFGTKEAPAVVKSVYDKRMVGCPGGEGAGSGRALEVHQVAIETMTIIDLAFFWSKVLLIVELTVCYTLQTKYLLFCVSLGGFILSLLCPTMVLDSCPSYPKDHMILFSRIQCIMK